MGYAYSLRGALDFDPPLPYKAFVDSQLYPDGPEAITDQLVVFETQEVNEVTDVGLSITVTATALTPTEESVKIYDLDEQLDAALSCVPEGTKVTGYIEAQGEDGESWFRVYPAPVGVAGRRWKRVYARLLWPLAAEGVGQEDESRVLGRG